MSNENKVKPEAKADADAKAKADAVAKAKAEILAEAKAKAQAEAEIKAEAEAKAIADAKAKAEAYENAKWDEEPNKDMLRVFRVLKPPTKKVLMTLQMPKRVVDEIELPAPSASIAPNSAQQYVLRKGAIEYKRQLVALRNHVATGFIEEVDPQRLGIVWIPPEQVKLAEAEALVEKLKAQI